MQAAGYVRFDPNAAIDSPLLPGPPAAWRALPGGALDAWLFDLRHAWQAATPPEALLSHAELGRAERFASAPLRSRYAIGRAHLRTVLGGYLGVEPARLRLAVEEGGKPCVEGLRTPRQLHFNLSHSGDWLLVAAAWNRRVGADVETERSRTQFLDIARRFFHPAEVEALLASADSERFSRFLRCWTLKEAHAKALGIGLPRAMGDSDFSRWLDVRRPALWSCGGEAWHVVPLQPLAGAVASVLYEASVR